jgi:nucleoside-diphosphate-sugar epimerase
VESVDAVVHLAGLTTARTELRTEAQYQESNGAATGVLARAAADAGVKRFVYVSSLAAQGPADDPTGRMPPSPRPMSAYGRSKLAGEWPVLAERERMSVAIVRPPIVYGPRDRAIIPLYKIVRLGLMPVLGDGQNLLSWVHVHDCADAIVQTVLAAGPTGAIYPISDGTPHTWRELIRAFSKAIGRRVFVLPTPALLFEAAGYAAGAFSSLTRRPLPLSPDEVRHMKQRYLICDHEAITDDLGWKPRIGIEEGLAGTMRWYREHGWM